MKQKRVFVLGAGSSIGHSNGISPSVKEFFKIAQQYKIINTAGFENLITYINKTMDVNLIEEESNIDIEKLATMIEIEIERNPSAKMLGVRESLLNLIEKVLSAIRREVKGNNGEYYLLKKMLKSSDTVLTFNWDLLLDDILDRDVILKGLYSKGENVEKGEGLYYNFIYHISDPGESTWDRLSCSAPYQELEQKYDTGYFLKLHGSIDWLYCVNEYCRAYRKVFPFLKIAKDVHCGECHEELHRLLIPPVLNKAYRQYPLIRKIWNFAIKEINVAEEVIIWGYSLPPTDFYAYWLLKHVCRRCKNIILINPGIVTGKKDKKSITFLRPFYDAFSWVSRSNIKLYEYYHDYYEGCDIYEKYGIKKPQRKYHISQKINR